MPNKRLPSIPFYKLAPNIVTILGLCIGISSVRYALDGKWEIAAGLIIIAAFMDGIDGRLARFLNSTSGFGAQLDSLADLVSFGVAPAVVMYLWSLHGIPLKGVGWAVVLFYIMCSALRLARFNAQLDDVEEQVKIQNYYTGLPMPAAAGMSLLPMTFNFQLITFDFSHWFMAGYMAFLGLLMVSRIPTFSFKSINVKRKYVSLFLGFATLVIAGTILQPWIVLPIFGFILLLLIPVSVFTHSKNIEL